MRALTVRQPYASRIVAGRKFVENRSRATAVRGPIAIHAAALVHDRFRHDAEVEAMTRGSFVGVTRLVEVHQDGTYACLQSGCASGGGETRAPGGFSAPVWHWLLADPVEFVTPWKARGALGFWEVGPSDDHLITLAVSEVMQHRTRGNS